MTEFILTEYPEEDYLADMRKLLKEKGLHDAVKVYCDKIDWETTDLSGRANMGVQEFLNDILTLIDLYKEDRDA